MNGELEEALMLARSALIRVDEILLERSVSYGSPSVQNAEGGNMSADDRKKLIAAIHRGLLTSLSCWCAAQRSEICDGRKTVEFPTGGVGWRRRPLRIGVRDETSAMRALRKAGMESFLRSCTDVSLGSILREPDAAPDLKGVEVRRVGEEFVVCLFGARL